MVHPTPGWCGNTYIMNNEPLLSGIGISVQGIRGNILKDFEVSEDGKVFTFHMREGLKWSDGVPVTTEDVLFAYEDVLLNEKLTPIFPSWLRAGGRRDGEPMKLEIIDDYTFRISFAEPYGGFPVQLAIAGWRRYDDLLKPKHYLKRFHPRYTPIEKLEPLIKEEGLAKGEWWSLFGLKDFLISEIMKPEAVGFPFLTPWIPVKSTPTTIMYERNPYYFKVDTKGNQLPYIDKVRLELVSNVEMVTMKILAGEVDFEREKSTLKDISLYKENEETGGYRTLLLDMHVNPPTAIFFNYTHPDPTWRKVVRDIRFRKALNMAINREEIIDAVYFGFGELPTLVPSVYDPAKANQLLDEMGLDKRDAEGYRLGPDGKTFVIPFEYEPGITDFTPVLEFVADQWKKNIGIKTTVKALESGLFRQRTAANEVKATIFFASRPIWRIYEDYLPWSGWWGVAWWNWYTTNGKEGEEPPKEIKRIFDLSGLIRAVAPDTPEEKKLLEELNSLIGDNLLFLPIAEKVKIPMIVSKRLGNVPHKGFSIAANYSMEQFFFKK